MKVLQINSVCGIGSTGRIATDIHNTLVEQGHESYIAYGRNLPKHCENAMKIGNTIDNYAHVIKTRIFDNHGSGSKKATLEFIEKVEELNPDVIHLHNIHGYYINIEILFNYLKETNKPVVWTLHDCWSFTGHCAYFDFVGCERWKTGCFECPEKRAYPSSLIFDNSINNFDNKKKWFTGLNRLTLVTPSNWLANLVRMSYLKDYPIKIINNGIDIKMFRPTESTFRAKYNLNDKFVILGVASIWDRRKGLKYFIELSDSLNDDEVIVLVGLSEDQLKQIPNKIVGISKTNDIHELVEIYSSADVFLNPTLEDNFPTTNIESLGCGTPVITFNTGGSPEIIDDSCGVIVERENTKELGDAINKLKTKNLKSEDCIKRAQFFCKQDRYNEYIDIYKNYE